jgi:acyl-CoA thioesterase I
MGARILPPLAALLFLALLATPTANTAYSAESPAYLALGDSLAFGVGATNPAAEGYVGLTHFELTSVPRYEEIGLDLVNVSEPGATSSDLLVPDGQLQAAIDEITARQAETKELPEGEPSTEVELISIDVGGNDLLALAAPEAPCVEDPTSDECRTALGATLATLGENLELILRDLRQAAPDAQIYAINLYNPYSGTGDEREVVASIGVEQVNGVIAAAAADPDLSIHLVDIHGLFEGRGNQWVASDRIHANDAGHRVISEALLAAIQERPVVIPEDLAPTLAPDGTVDNLGGTNGNGDGGNDTLIALAIAIPIAFLAGLTVTTVYFWARGRPA